MSGAVHVEPLPRSRRELRGWRRAITRIALGSQLLLGSIALLTLTLASNEVAQQSDKTTRWAAPEAPVTVAWGSALAARYPDCAPGLNLRPPGSVIELSPEGIPSRVPFAVAWRVTHDHVAGNDGGRIIALCRQA